MKGGVFGLLLVSVQNAHPTTSITMMWYMISVGAG